MIADQFNFSVTTAELLTSVGLVLTILGGMWLLNRWLINTTISEKLEETVAECVARHVLISDTKLDAILLNVRENSAAVGRIHELEITIRNGLNERVADIDRKVDLLMGHALSNRGALKTIEAVVVESEST